MVQDNAIPCNTMQYHAIPCTIMQYHAIQCNTMQDYAIQCNTMQYHTSVITAVGAYHCPVGSIMAIFYFFVWGCFLLLSQICGKSNYIPTLSKVNTAADKLGSQNIVSLKYWGLDQFLSQKTTCIFNPIYFSRVDPPADELVQRHR